MQEKDNYLKNAELSTEQNYNMIDGILNNEPTPVPEPGREPLDKVKEPPRKKRSRERDVDGSVDPVRDMETINIELIFADMDTMDKRIEKAEKNSKSGDKKLLAEVEFLKRIKAHLESGKPVRSMELTDDEREYVDGLFLLTSKPVIYVANISEDDIVRK